MLHWSFITKGEFWIDEMINSFIRSFCLLPCFWEVTMMALYSLSEEKYSYASFGTSGPVGSPREERNGGRGGRVSQGHLWPSRERVD